MKKRFSEEQILGLLKQAEPGVSVKELYRQHGFSDASFCSWRAKFGGMSVLIAAWRRDYNEGRPRSYQTPAEFAAQHRNAEESRQPERMY